MPRPVAIRADYRNDAGYLLRFEGAIVKDTRQTEEWRKKTARKIRELVMLLFEADARTNAGGATGSKTSPPLKAATR